MRLVGYLKRKIEGTVCVLWPLFMLGPVTPCYKIRRKGIYCFLISCKYRDVLLTCLEDGVVVLKCAFMSCASSSDGLCYFITNGAYLTFTVKLP